MVTSYPLAWNHVPGGHRATTNSLIPFSLPVYGSLEVSIDQSDTRHTLLSELQSQDEAFRLCPDHVCGFVCEFEVAAFFSISPQAPQPHGPQPAQLISRNASSKLHRNPRSRLTVPFPWCRCGTLSGKVCILHRIGNPEFLVFIQLGSRTGTAGITKVKSKICRFGIQVQVGTKVDLGKGIWDFLSTARTPFRLEVMRMSPRSHHALPNCAHFDKLVSTLNPSSFPWTTKAHSTSSSFRP